MDRRDFLSSAALALPLMPWVSPAHGARLKTADFSWLDARLQERVSLGYFDGMSLIIGRGEAILHQRSFGKGGVSAVLHVASMGKWSAVAAIAVLVDEGKLSWADPVQRYLPEFSGPMGRATLRQLLSHTAGYPDYQPAGRRRDDDQSLSESLAQIRDLPASAEPGKVFQYGGLAMQVAGRMAEIVAGQSFDEIFQSRIARPLGMSASGYCPVSSEAGFHPMLGGGLFTCAADYARLLMMFAQKGGYAGQRLLSASSVAEMEANQIGGAQLPRGAYVEAARQDLRSDVYGLGIWREETDARGQATLLSSPGWAGAYAWVDRAAGIWGVVVAKANVDRAAADGYNTFIGSSIYAPMARAAMAEAAQAGSVRGMVPTAQGRLYYEESGQGIPVILVHGHSFDRRQWQPQVAALESRFRVIRYDLRGYGRSSMQSEGQVFSHADDLAALMDALGIGAAHLLGSSLGGAIVTDFLALHPARVLSAAMAGGDLFDVAGPDEPWTPEAIARRRLEIAALSKRGLLRFKQEWLEGMIRNSGSRKESLRQPLWRMIDEWQAWQPRHVEPRHLLGRSVRRHLEKSRQRTPVLVIRGDKEKMDWSIISLLPQAQRLLIPDCGHVSNLEQAELFNRRYLSWLLQKI